MRGTPTRKDVLESRQFTIRRMMFATAILAAVVALVRAYPVVIAELVTVNLLLVAPAAIVLLLAVGISRNRRRTFIVVGIFILVGWALSPTIHIGGARPPTFWYRFKVDFYSIGMFMLGGAVAGAMLEGWLAITVLDSSSDDA